MSARLRLGASMLAAIVAATAACERQVRTDLDRDEAERPRDELFIDFQKNWRKLVHTAPDLALPVVRPDEPQRRPWTPSVLAECAFSADAGGMVPQVTLTWVEQVGGGIEIGLVAQRQAASDQANQPNVPRLRFDLSADRDGFTRNRFSTALAANKLERFKLPPNSALMADEKTVLQTGPGLFAKLIDFNVLAVQDRDTSQRYERHTLVLRDLSPAKSYSIRIDRPVENQWHEDREFTFLTPACPS